MIYDATRFARRFSFVLSFVPPSWCKNFFQTLLAQVTNLLLYQVPLRPEILTLPQNMSTAPCSFWQSSVTQGPGFVYWRIEVRMLTVISRCTAYCLPLDYQWCSWIPHCTTLPGYLWLQQIRHRSRIRWPEMCQEDKVGHGWNHPSAPELIFPIQPRKLLFEDSKYVRLISPHICWVVGHRFFTKAQNGEVSMPTTEWPTFLSSRHVRFEGPRAWSFPSPR
jgi:hypothetical protein